MYSNSNVDSSDIAEYSKPWELMPTQWWPGLTGKNDALISHGKPRHNNISNVFEPIELLIPIEPWPVPPHTRDRDKNVNIDKRRMWFCFDKICTCVVWYFTLFGNNNTGHGFGYTCSSCQKRNAHHRIGYFQCIACEKKFKLKRKPIRKECIVVHIWPYQQWWSSRRPNRTANQSKWCTWEMWAEIVSWNDFVRNSVWSMRIKCEWAILLSTLPVSTHSSPWDSGTVRSPCRPALLHCCCLWIHSLWHRWLWPFSTPIPIRNYRLAVPWWWRRWWCWVSMHWHWWQWYLVAMVLMVAECLHRSIRHWRHRHQCVLYFSNFHFD